MTHGTAHVRRIAATLAAGTLVLSGCGSDDGAADPADSAPAATEDAAGDAPAADDAAGDDAAGDDGSDEADAPAEGDDQAEPPEDDEQAAPAEGAGGTSSSADLVPPGVVAEGDIGNGTIYTSEAPFEDIVAHYDAVVGEANFVNEEESAAVWVGEVDSTSISVNLSAGEGALFTVLVAERG